MEREDQFWIPLGIAAFIAAVVIISGAFANGDSIDHEKKYFCEKSGGEYQYYFIPGSECYFFDGDHLDETCKIREINERIYFGECW